MKKKIFIAFVIVVALSLTSISSVFAATVYKPKQFKVTGTGNYINEATWSASETGGGSGKLRVENYFSGYTVYGKIKVQSFAKEKCRVLH
ncbi:MAG: hypothetical protein WAW77_07960 [Caldibacillus thermoamylovorans]